MTLGAASPGIGTRPVPSAGALSAGEPLWERAFAWVALMLATGGCIPIMEWMLGIRGQGDALGGDPFAQAIWSTVYLGAALLLFLRFPRVVRALPALGTIWIIVVLAVVSSQWSVAPSVTMRRAVAFVGTTLVGLYLGTRFRRATVFRILFAVFATVVALSPVASILGFRAAPGTWQGVFGTKNVLGQAMVCSAIVSVLFAASEMGWRRIAGCVIFTLSVALLLLSNSKTSLVVLLAALALLIPLRLLRLRTGVAELAITASLVAAGAVGVWIAGNSAAVLNLLGRDATLTGRVQLWSLLLEMIQRQTWLGYGYGGFWLGWDGPSGPIWQICIARYGWLPPNGHDGFIDLALDLGLVGLVAFLVSLGTSLVRAVRLAHAGRSWADMFPVMFLYFTILANLTESALVTHNSLVWVLLVTSTVQLWSEFRPGRPATLPGAATLSAPSGWPR